MAPILGFPYIMERLFKKKGEVEEKEESSELNREGTEEEGRVSKGNQWFPLAGKEIGSYELTVWKESEEIDKRLLYWYKHSNEEKGVKELKEMLNRLEKVKLY